MQLEDFPVDLLTVCVHMSCMKLAVGLTEREMKVLWVKSLMISENEHGTEGTH